MLPLETSNPRLLVSIALVALAACGPSTLVMEPEAEASTTDEASESSSTTSAPEEPEATSDESTGEPPSSFIQNIDAGGAFECNLWTQDCPAGHKCTIWANDGGGAWNATKCQEIVADPDEPGEPCEVEGSGTSGIDTCALGSLCWDVDPETNEGVCRQFCQGDEVNPYCDDPDMRCGGHRNFPLCIPSCCPIEQDCEEGQACYPINDNFDCAPDASRDLGAFGDPCEFINVCDPGLMCLDASAVPNCEGTIGCCTPFCLVGTTTCGDLDPTMECAPWFEEGSAPPGLELVGACVVMK